MSDLDTEYDNELAKSLLKECLYNKSVPSFSLYMVSLSPLKNSGT
ncbi:hypothetical protein [Helicobacter cynogastricus]|nr:hypothetical protein [Helicobacter cynogastricus]